ncbi:MAG: hypothetical protein IJ929_01050 [Prevotella sp.]|nr:hypothetical protein [Prevotella sp.]
MKKNILFMTFGMAAMLMTSCGSTKPMVVYQQPVQQYPYQQQQQYPIQQQPVQQNTQPQQGSPFGQTFTMPTFEPDTEEYFAASGTANGPRARMDVLQRAALSNAQSIIRQKMKHAYKGVVSDYSNYMGMGSASDAMGKVEAGGDQIIDAVVNETMARDVRFSSVDDKGNLDCFVGVRIYKKQVVDKVIEGLSNDQELKLRFNEDQFRQRMEKVFKDYKESQQQ